MYSQSHESDCSIQSIMNRQAWFRLPVDAFQIHDHQVIKTQSTNNVVFPISALQSDRWHPPGKFRSQSPELPLYSVCAVEFRSDLVTGGGIMRA